MVPERPRTLGLQHQINTEENMTQKSQRLAIVGASIGGLTLAIALKDQGWDVQLYEQADELREVGAAVALSANATRFYEDRFGLKEQLGAKAYEVQALIYRDGRDGRLIAEHRFDYKGKYGHPYVGIHRADLQAILSGAVGMDSINLNKRLVDIDDSGSEAVLKFADGSSAAADLVIGADGAKSTVRRLMLGYDDAYYSGASAFRGIVEPEQMPSMPDPDAIQFWMGPGRHCLHYPIGNGAHNFFLVERHPSPWPHKAWIAPTNDQEKLAGFGSWHPAIIEMVNAVPVSERWGLFHRPPLGRLEPRPGDPDRGRGPRAGATPRAGSQPVHRGRHRPGRPAPVQLRLGRRPSGVRAASSGTDAQGAVRLHHGRGCLSPARWAAGRRAECPTG